MVWREVRRELGGIANWGNSEVIIKVLNFGILYASLYKEVVCSAFSFYYLTGKHFLLECVQTSIWHLGK